MSFCFIPSIQHMAAVRIALFLYYDKEIEDMLEIERKIHRRKVFFSRDRFEFWKLIETKAAEKLPTLPDSLKKMVSKFIEPIHSETLHWLCEHNFLDEDWGPFNSSPFLDYKSILCWRSNGSIDRKETAKKFAISRHFDPETRFAMACTYFLEDEVFALWHGDEALNLKSFRDEHGTNAAIRFWVKRLKKGTWIKKSWKAEIDGYFKNLRIWKYDFRLRLSCFFPYLSWEGKKNYFHSLRWHKGHSDDLCFCLREMDEEERLELFAVYPANILFYFLMWPFQSLFIGMAKKLWSLMTINQFQDVLHIIIFDYIIKGSEDFDYIGLLKEFWHLSPASYKRKTKKKIRFFRLVEVTLKYEGKNASPSLPETMEELAREICLKVSRLPNA